MALHDAAYHIGVETTYDTAVTPTRSYEVKTLQPEIETQILHRVGHRKGAQAKRHAKTIVTGSKHSVTMDVIDKGMGLLLQGLVGSTTGPTQVATTTAYTQQHDWTTGGPAKSLTAQQAIQYPTTGGGVWTLSGNKASGFKLSQSADGLLELTVDFVGGSATTATAEATAAYTAAAGVFSWADTVVTINSVAFDDVRDFEFALDAGLKTDRHRLRANPIRKESAHAGYASPTGTIGIDWTAATFYDLFIAGTEVPLNVKWSAAANAIEAGHTYEFELDIPAIVFTGEAPSQDSDSTDLASQSLPFEVVEPSTGALFNLKVKSTDTVL